MGICLRRCPRVPRWGLNKPPLGLARFSALVGVEQAPSWLSISRVIGSYSGCLGGG